MGTPAVDSPRCGKPHEAAPPLFGGFDESERLLFVEPAFVQRAGLFGAFGPGRRIVRLEDDVPRGRVAKFEELDAVGAGDERIGGIAGNEGAVALTQHFLAEAHLAGEDERSEEHTSELQSLMRISYAVFCLKKKKKRTNRRST